MIRSLPARKIQSGLDVVVGPGTRIGGEARRADITPAAGIVREVDALLAPRDAGLERCRHGNGKLVAQVGAGLRDFLRLLGAGLHETVRDRAIVGRIRDVGAGGLDEARVHVGLGAVDGPADVADSVGQGGLATVGQEARLLVVAAEAEIVVDLERAVFVLRTKIDDVGFDHEAVRPVVHDVELRRRDLANLRDLVGGAGDDAGSRARHGGGVAGEGGCVIGAAEALDVVVEREVERKLGAERVAVVRLHVHAPLLAVVVALP